MPSANDVYRVKLTCTFRSQAILNIFHYQLTTLGGSAGASELATGWVNHNFPELPTVLSSSTVFNGLEVTNLDDPTDFQLYAFSGVTGLASGTNLHQFITLSFQYDRSRTDMRAGGKRFGGLTEAQIDNGIVNTTVLAQCAALGSVLESAIGIGGSTYRPRVYGKRRGTLGMFPNPISGVSYNGSYSQNSRKDYTAPGF